MFSVCLVSEYPWLEYSQTKDAAFCFACRYFAPSGSRKESVFTTTGFRRWKKAQDSDSGFKKNVKSETHNSAMMRWNEFKTMVDQSTSVHQMVSEAYEKKCTKIDIILKLLEKFYC